ncbi:hypothetical protein [Bacillus phage MrBubbles]|nr:hypothetical protein [Bacillus phage MrBubbles]
MEKTESWHKLAPLGGNRMTRRLVCYKDVWETEEGETFRAAIKHDLDMLEDSKEPKLSCCEASGQLVSCVVKMYPSKELARTVRNVYTPFRCEYVPKKEFIKELLIQSGNKYAIVENVKMDETGYELV